MRFAVLTLVLAALTSCDSNPLGNTKISSCDHAPNFKTGLPTNCQVNFKNTENLAVWLDANDSGTVTAPNQTDVESWADKSGNSVLFQSFSNFSILLQKQANSRASIKWTSDTGLYSSSALSGFNADQDFALAVTLKTQAANVDKFKIDNGSGNGFEVFIDSSGTLNYKLSAAAMPVESFSIVDDTIAKFIISFQNSTKELFIYNDSELVSTNQISGSSSAWAELRLSGAEDVEISEILIYDSFPSEAEVIEIQTYLNNKWGF